MSIKILTGFVYIFAGLCQKQPEQWHLLPQQIPHMRIMLHYILLILIIVLTYSFSNSIGM